MSTSHRKSPAPTIEEVEDEDIRPHRNDPPKNPHHILELSDDSDEDSPLNVKKFPKNGSRKKSKARPTVIESSDDSMSDDNNKKKTRTANTKDSDPEVERIEKVKETPEEELGELSTSIMA